MGHRGVIEIMAAQLGLAMIPRCSRMAPGLISGTTRGTSASIRNAEELSTTTAPLLTATGANFLEVEPPAENSPMLTPSRPFSVSSWTGTDCPRNGRVLPAERADANKRNSDRGKLRRSRHPNSSIPTAPVAPAMATTGAAERPDCIVISQFNQSVEGLWARAGKQEAPLRFRSGASFDSLVACLVSISAREPPEAPWASWL